MSAYSKEATCFNCRHYLPNVAEGWKPEWQGHKFTIFSLRDHLGSQNQMPHPEHGWPGKCRLNPVPVDVRSTHICASHAINPDLIKSWREFVDQWATRDRNIELQKQLKAAQQLARDRFRKLRSVKAKAAKPSRRASVPPDSLAPPA